MSDLLPWLRAIIIETHCQPDRFDACGDPFCSEAREYFEEVTRLVSQDLLPRLASIPRLKITGEQMANMPPETGNEAFFIDWDEYDEFLPWSAVGALMESKP